MSRLASLNPANRTPASPSSRAAASPSRNASIARDPTSFHSILRDINNEVRTIIQTWDEICVRMFASAKGVVDEGTEIDNILAIEEPASRPSILPHKLAYDKHASGVKDSIAQLEKLLVTLRTLVEKTDLLFFKFIGDKTAESALAEPFWPARGTWTLERFVNELRPVTIHHAEHLAQISHMMDRLLNPLNYTSFDSPTRKSSDPEKETYDRQAIFTLQKETLELFRDMIYRSSRHEWRDWWLEVVDMEMDGWAKDKKGDEDGYGYMNGSGSPRVGGGVASARKGRNGRNGDRAASIEPG